MKSILTGRLTILVGAATLLAGCSPKPTGLDRTTGAPHDLVMVQGDDLGFSIVLWDGVPIPGGWLGGFMFSVPPDAANGDHKVALQNWSGRSDEFTFKVEMSGRPFPKPRIDHVTMLGSNFDAGSVTATLYVQGANFDVGAVVEIDNAIVATHAHKGLRTDWYGVSAADLDYPIYHYLSTVALTEGKPPGHKLHLRVKNLDGQWSEPPFEYSLPMDAASVDRDGDKLLDSWEVNGYDADSDGDVDVDVRGLGVDPLRRDVLVELDIMDNLAFRPDLNRDVFDGARAIFRSAPIINPLSDDGINLILDTSGKPCLTADGTQVCTFTEVCFDALSPTGACTWGTEAKFSALKAQSFDGQRGRIFHYGIWGISEVDGSASGMSDRADDFLVSFDTFPNSFQTPRSMVETLVHELGHDLAQQHGGTDSTGYKPNYWSVMSYMWQLRTGQESEWRSKYRTCAPMYYANKDVLDDGPALPTTLVVPPGSPNAVATTSYTFVDYSHGMGKTFQVSSEGTARMCGVTVVWNNYGLPAGDVKDYSNWRNLKYDGPSRNVGGQ